MNEPADLHGPRWFARPIVWLGIGGLLLMLLAMAVWWGARSGVRAMQRLGAVAEWDVPDAAYWAEEHLGISTDVWMWDGSVTWVYVTFYGGCFPATSELCLDDAGLYELRRFPRLTELEFTSELVTDAGIERLIDAGGLRRLSSLQLDECPSVSRRGLAMFSQLPHLESLWITSSSMDVSGADLARFTQLQTLHTDTIPLTNADLDTIARLPRLTWLDLYDTKIDDSGLAALAHCPQLTTLDLSGSRVTDAGVVEIARHCPNLESLWLDRTKVTDDCLSVVERMPNLCELYVSDTAVTEAAARKIMVARPEMDVTADSDSEE